MSHQAVLCSQLTGDNVRRNKVLFAGIAADCLGDSVVNSDACR